MGFSRYTIPTGMYKFDYNRALELDEVVTRLGKPARLTKYNAYGLMWFEIGGVVYEYEAPYNDLADGGRAVRCLDADAARRERKYPVEFYDSDHEFDLFMRRPDSMQHLERKYTSDLVDKVMIALLPTLYNQSKEIITPVELGERAYKAAREIVKVRYNDRD